MPRQKRGRKDDPPKTTRALPSLQNIIAHSSNSNSKEDRQTWNGWCEIESDPYGVRGVKVQEIFSLEVECLRQLSRPIYGLIFLFKWNDESNGESFAEPAEGIWFANQTVDNACASIALLNVVNNIPFLELGEQLQGFKTFTEKLSPALRGYAVANWEFIKQIHNSFARKFDMLHNDLVLKRSAKGAKITSLVRNDQSHIFEDAFHFSALVPIDGVLWQLDGLEKQPKNLGPIKCDDWLDQSETVLRNWMSQGERGGLEFAILSLAQDPILGLQSRLTENLSKLRSTMAVLDTQGLSWRNTLPETQEFWPRHLHTSLKVGDGLRNDGHNTLAPSSMEDIQHSAQSETGSEISIARQVLEGLLYEHSQLESSIQEEAESRRKDEERCYSRRHEYNAAILTWLKAHADKNLVEEILKYTQE